MRRSELAGAERELLDLDAAMLEIGDTRVVVDGKAEESDGKTESGRRTISLDPLTVALPAPPSGHAGCRTGSVRGQLPRFGLARLPPGRPPGTP